MALLTGIYTLTIPFILIFSIPLLLCAIVTSFLAFTVLTFRVFIIYFDLAVAVIPYYLSPFPAQLDYPSYHQNSYPSAATSPTQPTIRRKRRTSSISIVSSAISSSSITPSTSSVHLPYPNLTTHNSTSNPAATINLAESQSQLRPSPSVSSIKSNPLAFPSTLLNPYLHKSSSRDFEGVGGWRLDCPDEEDALWTTMNSRLELPGLQGVPVSSSSTGPRGHRRSTTAGSMNVSNFGYEKSRTGSFGSGKKAPSTAKTSQQKHQSKWSGSGIWASRSTSPETERVKVVVGESQKERESNVGRVRTPLDGGEGTASGHGSYSTGSYAPRDFAASTKAIKQGQSASIMSGSSGSSKSSSVLSIKKG